MGFLKDLIMWFITGRVADRPDAPAVPKSIAFEPEPVRAKPVDRRKRPKETNGDWDNGKKAYSILEELKSIEPVSKEFQKAREELLQELKKLAPRKRNGG